MRKGFYLWQYDGIGDMAIEVEGLSGKAVVPTSARTCPPQELIGGGMTLTPLVALTEARVDALQFAIGELDAIASDPDYNEVAARHTTTLRAILNEIGDEPCGYG